MTRPKSRSIVIPLSASTPKPAIEVMPEASTAVPVRAYVSRSASPIDAPGLALLVVAGREDHAELGGDGDHERAERRRHRVERDVTASSTSDDQPVASAIGSSGTSAREAER